MDQTAVSRRSRFDPGSAAAYTHQEQRPSASPEALPVVPKRPLERERVSLRNGPLWRVPYGHVLTTH